MNMSMILTRTTIVSASKNTTFLYCVKFHKFNFEYLQALLNPFLLAEADSQGYFT